MAKNKTDNIIRANAGSAALIIKNGRKGTYYFIDDDKYKIIKNGEVLKEEYDTLEELINKIRK